jgi:hypothetical protein
VSVKVGPLVVVYGRVIVCAVLEHSCTEDFAASTMCGRMYVMNVSVLHLPSNMMSNGLTLFKYSATAAPERSEWVPILAALYGNLWGFCDTD